MRPINTFLFDWHWRKCKFFNWLTLKLIHICLVYWNWNQYTFLVDASTNTNSVRKGSSNCPEWFLLLYIPNNDLYREKEIWEESAPSSEKEMSHRLNDCPLNLIHNFGFYKIYFFGIWKMLLYWIVKSYLSHLVVSFAHTARVSVAKRDCFIHI